MVDSHAAFWCTQCSKLFVNQEDFNMFKLAGVLMSFATLNTQCVYSYMLAGYNHVQK